MIYTEENKGKSVTSVKTRPQFIVKDRQLVQPVMRVSESAKMTKQHFEDDDREVSRSSQ